MCAAELKQQHGLATAKKVLLTGGSAGGIGTFKNVDWLASQLPGAVVKGAPEAGWFFPAALPADLPNIYAPSDWAHFSVGAHGNPSSVNNSEAAFVQGELWQSQGLYPPACVEQQKPDEWWACGSIDKWCAESLEPMSEPSPSQCFASFTEIDLSLAQVQIHPRPALCHREPV